MEFVILLAGLAIIVKSADILISSSSKIAHKYGISTFIIGITVVAFGTSTPELVVGLMSGINKTNQLTLGNIVGSAFSNTALIVGIAAIIMPLAVRDSARKREIPILILVQLALSFMVLGDGTLSRLEGVILLIGFATFLVYIMKDSKRTLQSPDGEELQSPNEPKPPEGSTLKLWIFCALSLIGLFVGGKLAVDSSTKIATNFGLDETIIGLTVVAIATTLPELIASLMAIRRREPDIVLGNCIGSNLFNILLVLGLSSTINPISVQGNMLPDMIYMLALTVLVFLVSLFAKKLPRFFGIVLLLSYIAYISLKVITIFT